MKWLNEPTVAHIIFKLKSLLFRNIITDIACFLGTVRLAGFDLLSFLPLDQVITSRQFWRNSLIDLRPDALPLLG